MCFSAEASFGASAVLFIVGVATIKKVKEPAQIAFASIPFVFSIQQLSEGFVWLCLSNKDYIGWEQIPTHIFLIFAQVVWPTLVPLSILLLEKEARRKKILYIILGMGALLSIYLTYCLLSYNAHAKIIAHHIQYELDFPHINKLLWLTSIFYFIPTVISPIISSIKKMQILGVIILASFIFTKIFFGDSLISVWCFFAATISVMVLAIIHDLKKSFKETKLFSSTSS